jgi:hypothetical protein
MPSDNLWHFLSIHEISDNSDSGNLKGDQFQILLKTGYILPSYQDHIKSMLSSN